MSGLQQAPALAIEFAIHQEYRQFLEDLEAGIGIAEPTVATPSEG